MCSREEGLLREQGQSLSIFERDPNFEYKAKPEWTIKKYEKSSPGDKVDKPLEIETLKKITDYLIAHVLDVDKNKTIEFAKQANGDPFNFWDIYCFISDRFRSVNKDLTMLADRVDSSTNIEVIKGILKKDLLNLDYGFF